MGQMAIAKDDSFSNVLRQYYRPYSRLHWRYLGDFEVLRSTQGEQSLIACFTRRLPTPLTEPQLQQALTCKLQKRSRNFVKYLKIANAPESLLCAVVDTASIYT
jgi:hypothetical protein